jgi:hypothetical protein
MAALHRYNSLLPLPHSSAAPREGAALLASLMSEFAALETSFAKDGAVSDWGRVRRQLKKLVRAVRSVEGGGGCL